MTIRRALRYLLSQALYLHLPPLVAASPSSPVDYGRYGQPSPSSLSSLFFGTTNFPVGSPPGYEPHEGGDAPSPHGTVWPQELSPSHRGLREDASESECRVSGTECILSAPYPKTRIGEALHTAWTSIYDHSENSYCLDPGQTIPRLKEYADACRSNKELCQMDSSFEEPVLVVWQMTLLDTLTVIADYFFRDVLATFPSNPDSLSDGRPTHAFGSVSPLDGLLSLLICEVWVDFLLGSLDEMRCLDQKMSVIQKKTSQLYTAYPYLETVRDIIRDWAYWVRLRRSPMNSSYDGMIFSWTVDPIPPEDTLNEILDFLWSMEWER